MKYTNIYRAKKTRKNQLRSNNIDNKKLDVII